MNRRAVATVIAIVLVLVGLNWSRFALDTGEPVFLQETPGVWVFLGEGFPESGFVRQFNDECCLQDVIDLTGLKANASTLEKLPIDTPVVSGRRIDLIMQGSEIQSIYFSWMTAGQRVALGIPLHPDRMTLADWEFLPGLGPMMAAKIEENRQKNGDFGSVDRLLRVKGVGESKMSAWKEFF